MKGVDGSQTTGEKLTAALLGHWWHSQCEIIPDYMPPYPSEKTRPRVVVRYARAPVGEERERDVESFLRYSKGPRQGTFWDLYGDDFLTVELAIIALSQAQPPPKVRWAPIEEGGS